MNFKELKLNHTRKIQKKEQPTWLEWQSMTLFKHTWMSNWRNLNIENTLEQFCGILDEALETESEEECLGQAVYWAMYAEFSDEFDSLIP